MNTTPPRPHAPDIAADPARLQALQALWQDVAAQPWAYDFFALLRRIETLRPDLPRLGRAARPQQEALRLGQKPELDFAPAALASLETGSGVPRLAVRFFGLLGPQGPLPLHLTEYVRDRAHNHGDRTPAAFLDLFHHRMLALFYRAWAQAQPVAQRDRPDEDRYAAWLGALIGLGPAGRGATGATGAATTRLPRTALLHQAGLLAGRSRHPEGLVKILTQYFRVPVAVRCHVPHWLPIDRADRCRLGHARNRAARNAAGVACLGRDATVGRKAWDRQYKFRIELGPLTLAQYQAFLPGGKAGAELAEWVRLYIGHDLQWDLQLGLRGSDVHRARLGRGMRLGLTSWVGPGGKVAGRERPPRDRFDLHLRPGLPASPPQTRRSGALHG